MTTRTFIRLAAACVFAAASAAQASGFGGALELDVPYQLEQLSPAVKQSRVRCEVFEQAIAPAFGGVAVANGTANIPVSGPSASGRALVKVSVPPQRNVKSYRCNIQLNDGKTWTNAVMGGNLPWAKAGAGSVLSVKGKVPPRPTLPGMPQPPSIPGGLL